MRKEQMFLLVLLLLVAGCSSMDDYYAEEAAEINRSEALDLNNPDYKCEATDESCVCMVCENSGFQLINPFNQFYSMDLEGGECYFQTNCTEEKFLDISGEFFWFSDIFGPDRVRFFMLGQGSNFAEFADATRFCNNSLRFSVRWLASSEGLEYPLPQAQRGECFLDKDILPMYLLYSEGKAIDVRRAALIASQFEESGPVILTSEFDFDASNLSQMDRAVEQAIAMKDECPDCLIAIAPSFNYSAEYGSYNDSYDALQYIFNESNNAQEARSKIDLVAVGVNSHHSRNCAGASLLWDALKYSRYSMEEYGKPTIWAYVLLDSNQPNTQEYSAANYCIWSPDEITKTYGQMYKSIPSLISAGVLGVAPYSLYGLDTGPLACEDCGLMSINGTIYPEHTMWFSLCQVYYTGWGLSPIVFSPSQCADCSYAENMKLYQLTERYMGSSPDMDELLDNPVEPSETFFRCNGQLITSMPSEIDLGGYVPNIDTSDDLYSQCEIYPELDIYSDLRDLDPVLTRAFAHGETGLSNPEEGPGGDMCAASQLPASQCTGCLPQVEDPAGICTQSAPQGKEFHSLGIMQVHTYPYIQWDDGGSDDYRDQADWCGNYEFNPFNKAHNACLGTAIILDKLRYGKNMVNSNEAGLGLTYLKSEYGEDSPEYTNLKNAYVIFISSYYYSGFSAFHNNVDSWIYEYSTQAGIDDDYCSVAAGSNPCCNQDGTAKSNNCCGVENFINYYQSCKLPTLSNQQAGKYGLRLLGAYKALLDCEKYDADAHRANLIDYMESHGDEVETEEPEQQEQ
ncbi:MAG: hypothetical protein ACLFUZ_04730 [Candidatus Micrarchaeia archaeon]